MIRATEAISLNGTLRGGGGLQSEPFTYRYLKLGERKKNKAINVIGDFCCFRKNVPKNFLINFVFYLKLLFLLGSSIQFHQVASKMTVGFC